jgi:hypothetical protein
LVIDIWLITTPKKDRSALHSHAPCEDIHRKNFHRKSYAIRATGTARNARILDAYDGTEAAGFQEPNHAYVVVPS